MTEKDKKEEPVAEEINQQQHDPQMIQPSPVPTTFQVAAVSDKTTGQQFTMLVISTATGRSVYFLDSSVANTVGETLIKTAEATRGSGLIVPQLAAN